MWFLLRMTFWLGIVLVLLPDFGSQPVPKSQINATSTLMAAKDIVTDIRHICERQRAACAVGSETTVTLGQRAQLGAKMLYEFLSEQFGSDGRTPEPISATVPASPRSPLQNTLRQTDLAPPWRAPQSIDDEDDKSTSHVPHAPRTHTQSSTTE